MKKPKNFEEAMQRLEAITAELEQGDLPLEASVEKYQEGIELSKYCTDKLNEAEKKIKVLTSNRDGFELDESEP